MSRKYTTLPYEEKPVAQGNFDSNRNTIDRIVIHTTVGSKESAFARFNNPNSKVSAHYIIGLNGKIYALLEEYLVAYHSGNYPINQRSIGIEHEDGGDYNGIRPDILYQTSAKLVADICKFYNIPVDSSHVIPHRQVKATACPDSLDVDRIIREAKVINENPEDPAEEVISDSKTKINLGEIGQEEYGVQEVQAIKSMILAKDRRIKQLEENLTEPIPQLPEIKEEPAPVSQSKDWLDKLLELVRRGKDWIDGKK